MSCVLALLCVDFWIRMEFYKPRYDYDEVPVEDIRLNKFPMVSQSEPKIQISTQTHNPKPHNVKYRQDSYKALEENTD